MIKPLLEKAEDGRWYCRWQLTPSGKVWGTSHSSDLLKWAPQQYVNAEKPAVPRLVTARQIVLDKDTLNGYMQKVPYADIEQLIRLLSIRNSAIYRIMSVPNRMPSALPD